MINDLLNTPYSINYENFLNKKVLMLKSIKENGVPLYILRKPSPTKNERIHSPFFFELKYLRYNGVQKDFNHERISIQDSSFFLNQENTVINVETDIDEVFKGIGISSSLTARIFEIIEVLFHEVCGENHQDLFYPGVSNTEVYNKSDLNLKILNIPLVLQYIKEFCKKDTIQSSPFASDILSIVNESIHAIESERDLLYFWNIYHAISLTSVDADPGVVLITIPLNG